MKLEYIEEFDSPFASSCFQAMKSIQSKLERMKNDDGQIDEVNYVMSLAGYIGEEIESNDFLLGGELRKQITTSNKELHELMFRLKREYKSDILSNTTVKPDYVIHYSVKRDELSIDTQKLVIEAKTTNKLTQDNFSWDLYKLMAYVSELSFQTAVFLILNTSKNKIEKFLNGYKKQKLPVIRIPKGSLLFFIQDSTNSDPKPYFLNCLKDT